MAPSIEAFKIRVEDGASLALFHKPAGGTATAHSNPVLCVHGATFPTQLSFGFRFDGHSWMDDLSAAGFSVWFLDFLGYGGSDRYPVPTDAEAPTIFGRTGSAVSQIKAAGDFIANRTGAENISIISHSWGTMPAGAFCGTYPERVHRHVMFGPIAMRKGPLNEEPVPPQLLVTVPDQHTRFTADVPLDQPPVLLEDHFPAWGEAYLDSDVESRTRNPHAVAVPYGPAADIRAAWNGLFPYDPDQIIAPTMIVRWEWDSLYDDADAKWLFDSLTACDEKQDVQISHATHLMHLERRRFALYAACRSFLALP